ncbi:MAG: hypothetical protein IT371_00660 [Deltaproteobacteria bacterium]|nr:hypothetical protein [Deltaproteobacteria bacterium]
MARMRPLLLVTLTSVGALGLPSGLAWGKPPVKPPAPPYAVPEGTEPRASQRIENPETRAVLKAEGIDPDLLRCNSTVTWHPPLARYSQELADKVAKHLGATPTTEQRKSASREVLGYLVRTIFDVLQTQNVGVLRLKGRSYRDATGKTRPVLVYRSGVITDPLRADSCLRTLIRHGRVQHVVNLYGGEFPFLELVAQEERVAKEMGATHYDISKEDLPWRALVKKPADYARNLKTAMGQVAGLIRREILSPKGGPPRGHVYFHCGGGMHRSGMIFGILRRCINGDPMSQIEAEYKRHTAFRSAKEPGGYEALNVRFIRDFDCSLLQAAGGPAGGAPGGASK